MAFDPFACPASSDITAISAGTCMAHLEQTIGLYFQETQATYTITPTTAKLLATWTPLFAAADATIVTKSPLMVGVTIPKSEGIFTGGNDNTTVGGLTLYKGEGSVRVEAMIRTSKADMIDSFRGYTPFTVPAGSSTLNAYLIGRNKRISGLTQSAKLVPIPIHNLRISSVGSEGFNSFNEYAVSWEFLAGWDEGFTTVIATDFDPAATLLK